MLNNLEITCDRDNERRQRTAVWHGRELISLYIDSEARPDWTGAIVRGQVARVLAGQRTAYIDCSAISGESFMVRVRTTAEAPLRAGTIVAVHLTTAPRHGKAWGGAVVLDVNVESSTIKNSIIAPPPTTWQRAIVDYCTNATTACTVTFADKKQVALCQQWLACLPANTATHITIHECGGVSPHPQLDDLIPALLSPHVAFNYGGGANANGSLVIETTEALTAVDVNADESANPTAVNMAAIRELAQQLRLRNLAGIIVMDALKMPARPDNAKLVNVLTRAVATDPALVQMISISRIGLLEFTRQRRGYSLTEIYNTSPNQVI